MRPDQVGGNGGRKPGLNSGLDRRTLDLLSRSQTTTYRSSGLVLKDGKLFDVTDLIKSLKIVSLVKEVIGGTAVKKEIDKYPKRASYLVGLIDRSAPKSTGPVIALIDDGRGGINGLSAFGGVQSDYPRKPHIVILPVIKIINGSSNRVLSHNVAIDPDNLTLRAEASEERLNITAEQNKELEQFIQRQFPRSPIDQILHAKPDAQ